MRTIDIVFTKKEDKGRVAATIDQLGAITETFVPPLNPPVISLPYDDNKVITNIRSFTTSRKNEYSGTFSTVTFNNGKYETFRVRRLICDAPLSVNELIIRLNSIAHG